MVKHDEDVVAALLLLGEAVRRVAARLARSEPRPEHGELLEQVDRRLREVKERLGVTS